MTRRGKHFPYIMEQTYMNSSWGRRRGSNGGNREWLCLRRRSNPLTSPVRVHAPLYMYLFRRRSRRMYFLPPSALPSFLPSFLEPFLSFFRQISSDIVAIKFPNSVIQYCLRRVFPFFFFLPCFIFHVSFSCRRCPTHREKIRHFQQKKETTPWAYTLKPFGIFSVKRINFGKICYEVMHWHLNSMYTPHVTIIFFRLSVKINLVR